MVSKACVKFIRISPRKVRYVLDMVRAKSVLEARTILAGSPRRAGEIIQKLLNQAVDAAAKNARVAEGQLFISKLTADGGPTMKRFRPMSMGRAGMIRKRTSHIHLELDLRKGAAYPAAPAPKRQPEAKTQASAGKASADKPAKKGFFGKRAGKKMAGAK